MTTKRERSDICYGPIAPGQFFIDRMNPGTPMFYKAVGDLVPGVLICEMWGMNERRNEWRFGKYPNGGGYQIATSNLERMERVSASAARLAAEKELRRRDDAWRARYDPSRAPIKILRCNCGLTDDDPRQRHTMFCPMREF
jgi:hypothetical protein